MIFSLACLPHDVTVDVSVKGHGAVQVVVQLVGVLIHSAKKMDANDNQLEKLEAAKAA